MKVWDEISAFPWPSKAQGHPNLIRCVQVVLLPIVLLMHLESGIRWRLKLWWWKVTLTNGKIADELCQMGAYDVAALYRAKPADDRAKR